MILKLILGATLETQNHSACLIEFEFYIHTEISRARSYFGDVRVNHLETNELFTKTAVSADLNVCVGLSERILRRLPTQAMSLVL